MAQEETWQKIVQFMAILIVAVILVSYMEPAMSSAAAAVKRVCEWGGTA